MPSGKASAEMTGNMEWLLPGAEDGASCSPGEEVKEDTWLVGIAKGWPL